MDETDAPFGWIMGAGLEQHIWKPDLRIWNAISFSKWNGLTGILNDIHVRQDKGCPPVIEISWEVAVRLRCQMNLEWYPFDKNICHVKVGSQSFSQKDLCI